MKVVFSSALTEDFKTDLVIQKIQNDVQISVEMNDLTNKSNSNRVFHYLSKQELNKFIGALLHIQSKMIR